MSLLEKYQKNVIGSSGETFDYIPLISSKGDFTRLRGIEAVIASWNNILMTPIRTYDNNPEYGSELYKYVFEIADSETEELIKNEIVNRLIMWDDSATITSIEVTFNKNSHSYSVYITLSYNGETGNLTLNIDGKNYLNIL